MNLVVMMGRLTRDPEVRYSAGASGTTVARFSIAVDRRFKREGQPDADFFDCTAFGRTAEFVDKYIHKGTKIVLNGQLQNDNYQGRDGQMVYRIRILVDNIEFAESKAVSQQNAAAYNSNQGREAQAPKKESLPAPSVEAGDGFMNIPDGIEEELPFA
ncbi:MAG: single-stranded DNA-binding protein [Lachnospiraceae bacterium]|nr:single-stranded DNA-binding protein [Lachnospiraceae bacterium]